MRHDTNDCFQFKNAIETLTRREKLDKYVQAQKASLATNTTQSLS